MDNITATATAETLALVAALLLTLRFIAGALAVYRVSRLITLDDGPASVFVAVRAWVANHDPVIGKGEGARSLGLAQGVQCPYCVGVWVALPVTVMVLAPTPFTDVLLAWLGLTGAQDLLQTVAP